MQKEEMCQSCGHIRIIDEPYYTEEEIKAARMIEFIMDRMPFEKGYIFERRDDGTFFHPIYVMRKIQPIPAAFIEHLIRRGCAKIIASNS